MGSKSTPQVATTEQQQTLPAWYTGAAQNYLGRAQELSNQPYPVVPLTADHHNALQAGRGALGQFGTSFDTLNRMQQPGQTPGLQSAISQAQDSVMARLSRPGALTNSGAQAVAAKEMGDIAARMELGAYNADQNRAIQAAGMVPGLAASELRMGLGMGDVVRNSLQQHADAPYRSLGVLGGALQPAGLGAPRGTTTTNTRMVEQPGLGQTLFGGALGIGGMLGGLGWKPF